MDPLLSPDDKHECTCCGEMRATLRDEHLGPVCGGCYGQLIMVSLEFSMLGLAFKTQPTNKR